MKPRHPDDVQLMLTFAKDASGAVVRVDLDAELADTGDQLFRCSMTNADFARLLSAGVTVVRSSAQVPRPGNAPECQETDHSTHGDCDGRVREYTVATGRTVAGQVKGESVLLCASHATCRGPAVRRADYAGGPR